MQVLSQAFIYGNLEISKYYIWESYSFYLKIIIIFIFFKNFSHSLSCFKRKRNSIWNF